METAGLAQLFSLLDTRASKLPSCLLELLFASSAKYINTTMPTYRGPGLLAPLALLTRAHGMDLVGWARVGFSVILLSLRTYGFFSPSKLP